MKVLPKFQGTIFSDKTVQEAKNKYGICHSPYTIDQEMSDWLFDCSEYLKARGFKFVNKRRWNKFTSRNPYAVYPEHCASYIFNMKYQEEFEKYPDSLFTAFFRLDLVPSYIYKLTTEREELNIAFCFKWKLDPGRDGRDLSLEIRKRYGGFMPNKCYYLDFQGEERWGDSDQLGIVKRPAPDYVDEIVDRINELKDYSKRLMLLLDNWKTIL